MVQDEILDRIPSERLKVYAVWTPILKEDDRKAAIQATTLFSDKRAVHFWDADKSLGNALGSLVTLPRGRKLAWDVYFVFDGVAEWQERAPQPADWMHQLGIDARLLDGEKLRMRVEQLLSASE